MSEQIETADPDETSNEEITEQDSDPEDTTLLFEDALDGEDPPTDEPAEG